jgi:hypothetical protein
MPYTIYLYKASELPRSLVAGGSRFQTKIENVFKWVKLRVLVANYSSKN